MFFHRLRLVSSRIYIIAFKNSKRALTERWSIFAEMLFTIIGRHFHAHWVCEYICIRVWIGFLVFLSLFAREDNWRGPGVLKYCEMCVWDFFLWSLVLTLWLIVVGMWIHFSINETICCRYIITFSKKMSHFDFLPYNKRNHQTMRKPPNKWLYLYWNKTFEKLSHARDQCMWPENLWWTIRTIAKNISTPRYLCPISHLSAQTTIRLFV